MICGISPICFQTRGPKYSKEGVSSFFYVFGAFILYLFSIGFIANEFFSKISSRTMLCVTVLVKKKGGQRGDLKFGLFFIFHPMWVFVDFSNTMSNSHEKTLYAYSYIL